MKSKFKIKDYDKARKIARYCEITMMIATLIAGLLTMSNVLFFEEVIVYFVALVISAISVMTGIISTILKKVAWVIDIDDIWSIFLTILLFIVIGIGSLFGF